MVLDFSFEGNVGEFQCYKKCGVCQEVDEKELETIQALFIAIYVLKYVQPQAHSIHLP